VAIVQEDTDAAGEICNRKIGFSIAVEITATYRLRSRISADGVEHRRLERWITAPVIAAAEQDTQFGVIAAVREDVRHGKVEFAVAIKIIHRGPESSWIAGRESERGFEAATAVTNEHVDAVAIAISH